jgi:Bifunctional DNA primase/polymerase, N-terminal/Primase C terminal 1 (PriCT-1)
MTTQLEFALWYAQSGMAILPLHWPVRHERSYRCSCGRRDCTSPAKHPFGRLAKKGLQDASKDPVKIASWFGQGQLNIGIATGVVSGIIALDVDPRHDGD